MVLCGLRSRVFALYARLVAEKGAAHEKDLHDGPTGLLSTDYSSAPHEDLRDLGTGL